MSKPTQENKSSDESKLNQNSIFKKMPKDTLAESQPTMRLLLLCENDTTTIKRP
jgi:hypothetical protein